MRTNDGAPVKQRCSIVVLLLLASCAGASGRDVPAKAQGVSALDAMRNAYATIDSYADSGHVTFSSSRGGQDQVDFVTTFTRGAGLRFMFRSPTRSSGRDMTGTLAVEGSRIHVDYLGRETDPESVQAAAHELQGVSLLSSILVPQLLFGMDPWAGYPSEIEESATETVSGRSVVRVQFSSPATGTLTTIWLSKATSLIERIQIDQRKSGHGITEIQYTVSSMGTKR